MDKKKINKILNSGSSSESDLYLLADALKLNITYIGSIYGLDSLKHGNYILLISPSEKIKNGHWVGLRITKNKVEYFDTYGQPPPKIIEDFIDVPIHYNNEQIQDLRSSHCGLYCIYFLKKGSDIVNKFKVYNTY